VAIVDEPLRRSRGRAEINGNSIVLTFSDDRVERWTPVGNRFVVEHWFPGSQFPAARAVLGIAERTPRERRSDQPAPRPAASAAAGTKPDAVSDGSDR
jgi:hypothetical protein